MSPDRSQPGRLAPLARPSGGFAMVAIDQREALREMFAGHQDGPVTDEQLTQFKVQVTRELSPYASGLLIDQQFGLDRVLAERAVAPGCALIVAADRLLPGPDELVASTQIDDAVDPEHVRACGAAALKLLVLWRPDEPPGPRVAMAERFISMCRGAGLIAILEPVARRPRSGGRFDREGALLAAARELGGLGADLYKGEVPWYGKGPGAAISDSCAQLTAIITSPWVVLSSGVDPADFSRAVALACAAGASGFLAGRAVWRQVIGSDDTGGALRGAAAARLRQLAAEVDAAVSAPDWPGAR